MAKPSEVELPNGPWWPALLQTAAWATRPFWFAEYCFRRFGDAYTIRSPSGQCAVHVSAPSMIEQVLDLATDSFRVAETDGKANADVRAGPYAAAREIAIDVDDGVHKRARRQAALALHSEPAVEFTRLISGVAERHVAAWPVDSVFPLYPRTRAIAREILLRSVIGVDGEELTGLDEQLADYFELGSRYAALHTPGDVTTDPQLRALEVAVESSVARLIDDRRGDPGLTARSDTLSGLLSDPETNAMSDSELVSLAMAMLVAGSDPLATMLAWSCDYLCHDKRVAEALRADLRTGSTRYLHAFTREVLRVRPVIPEVARTLSRPTRVDDFRLPAGVTVVANLYLLHRRPEIYSDPDDFKPERFLHQQPTGTTFLPFGGGLRRCLGAGLAMMVLKEVLRVIALNAELEPASKGLDKPRRRLASVVPRHGVLVRHAG